LEEVKEAITLAIARDRVSFILAPAKQKIKKQKICEKSAEKVLTYSKAHASLIKTY
jgi:hypothetical protein